MLGAKGLRKRDIKIETKRSVKETSMTLRKVNAVESAKRKVG
jgi:hypothetical protein